MHFYPFNIADYQSHTKHLSPIEDITYRRLLDWHYLHEKPLPNNIEYLTRVMMLNGCSTDVERMLNEFFTLTDNGWVNVRAMSEIQAYNDKLEKASKAGKASAATRKNNIKQTFNGCSTDVQPNNKQETINKKQETYKNITPLAMLMAMGLSEQLSKDWIKVRKEKKQAITQTALDRIKSHAVKHGYTFEQAITICCENSWAGFNVEWIKNKDPEKPEQPNWMKGML